MSSPYFCVVVTTVGQTSAQQQQQFFSLTQRSCVIGVWVRGAVRGCGLANRQRDDRRREFPLFSGFFLFLFFASCYAVAFHLLSRHQKH